MPMGRTCTPLGHIIHVYDTLMHVYDTPMQRIWHEFGTYKIRAMCAKGVCMWKTTIQILPFMSQDLFKAGTVVSSVDKT